MLRLFAALRAVGGLAGMVGLLAPANSNTSHVLAAQPPDGGAITGVVWQWQHTVTSTDFVAPDDPSRYTL